LVLKKLESWKASPPTTSIKPPWKHQGISKVKITPFVGVIIYGVITPVTYFSKHINEGLHNSTYKLVFGPTLKIPVLGFQPKKWFSRRGDW